MNNPAVRPKCRVSAMEKKKKKRPNLTKAHTFIIICFIYHDCKTKTMFLINLAASNWCVTKKQPIGQKERPKNMKFNSTEHTSRREMLRNSCHAGSKRPSGAPLSADVLHASTAGLRATPPSPATCSRSIACQVQRSSDRNEKAC